MKKRMLILAIASLIIILGGAYWYIKGHLTGANASRHYLSGSQSKNSQTSTYKVNNRELSFESGGNHIYGRALVPQTDKPVPTVIFSHGFGGNHEQEETMQEQLAATGIAVYSFDFAGGTGYSPGQSEGDMKDMSVLTEEENLKDALRFVRAQDFADNSKIYLAGASQGGVVSTLVAEDLGDQIAGLYLLYPAFSLFDDARERFDSESDIPNTYNLMGLEVGSRYFKDVYHTDIFDNMTYSGPVHIFHGDQDDLVPLSYSERAQKTFLHASLVTVKGGGHGFATNDQENVAANISQSILGEQ